MSNIQQNQDGTYSKTYSEAEEQIIRDLNEEIKNRKMGDQALWTEVGGVQNRLTSLETEKQNLTNLDQRITQNSEQLIQHQAAIQSLQDTIVVEAYSKTEMDSFMHPWKLEEITYPVADDTIPTNEMFDQMTVQQIKVGYAHFLGLNINEATINETDGTTTVMESNHFLPNTIRRYTINVYVSIPRDVTFNIHYGDNFKMYITGDTIQFEKIFQSPSFGGTERTITTTLERGWNKIQFLVANSTQGGGLYVTSDLMQVGDRFSSLDFISGSFSGVQIKPGTITEEHFRQDMNLKVFTLHASKSLDPNTNLVVPAVIAGNEEAGAIQIGDGTISKLKNEPFIFNDDVQLQGHLRTRDGKIIDESTIGSGLTTEERQRFDTIGWNAEENQMAFSYVYIQNESDKTTEEVLDLLAAQAKTDTLRLIADENVKLTIRNVEGKPPEIVIGISDVLDARIKTLEKILEKVSGELSAPRNFKVIKRTATTVELGWDLVSGAKEYVLMRGNTLVYQGPDNTFTDQGLTAGASYTYKVSTRNAVEIDGPPATLTVSTNLQPPQDFTLVSVTPTTAEMQWTPIPDVSQYQITRNGAIVFTDAVTIFKDTGLIPGLTYTYVLVGKKDNNTSEPKELVVTTTLAQPKLRITPVT